MENGERSFVVVQEDRLGDLKLKSPGERPEATSALATT